MLVLVLVTLSLVVITVAGTIFVGKSADANYDGSTKGNITRLTMIYILLAVVLFVGVGLYIYFQG
ncbi:hypothetical protein QUF88_17410 [Bacillus sp. DX1.1]|uniref:hypothetical protein n=1 Tax=unclassified Bacillus (in: firmicutes) TaxID=185979 RepID=UPI00256FFE5E|nr:MULTISPECIES: hypothetical protein [unclassified Bacillus (in: firmicutes)]MDM5155509.1 hypothetical protein [Bacillus sp. DX1.1]WJE79820.1 hypothetical protein QRE67_14935 [Bacillus sp. DX3.1]